MAGRRPLAAVVACSRVVDARSHQAVAERFLRPLSTVSDVDCVIVPAMAGAFDATSLASRIDVLLLTGSCSNMRPSTYGSGRPQVGRSDPGRDDAAIALASAMIGAGRPVLGICRGLQEINVLFGGTLDDDVAATRSAIHRCPDMISHPADFALYEATVGCVSHDVDVADGALGPARTARVVSAHGQGVDRLGAELVAEAVAPDGLVEALSWGRRVLAVQWHPEIGVGRDPESDAFFRAVGHAGRWNVAEVPRTDG